VKRKWSGESRDLNDAFAWWIDATPTEWEEFKKKQNTNGEP
jgi:hypothetical protein